jgi:hydroxymethylglutaryl-CoA lyase
MAELHAFLPAALLVGVRVAGYVSGAFGFAPRGRKTPIPAPVEVVVELASALVDLGASSVTLSDLQGLAGPSETSRVVGEVVAALGSSGPPVGYHPHHGQTEAALDNVEAAVRAGATIVDGSLGATGGCITGAPGNVPTEHVAERLVAMGATRGLDVDRIRRLAAEARVRVFAGT